MLPQTTILLIEDDEILRQTVELLLQHHRYTVLTAATRQEAEEIRQHVGLEAIDLVISNIHLTPDPRVQEGYVLYEQWSAERPSLPYLFISGDPTSQDLPAVRSGLVRLIPKPFLPVELLAAVRQVLGPEA